MKSTVLIILLFIVSHAWSQEPSEIFSFPDVEAQFPGGQANMQRYIAENITYPDEAIDKDIMGKVYLSFVVRTDGSITNVKIERSAHPILDKEAIRVVRSMPNWTPGEADGKKVPTRCRLPIVFTLTDGDDDKKKKRRRRR